MAATMISRRHSGGSKIRYIPLSYNNAESQTSALRLILALMPQWQHTDGKIEFIRFTDGITNTLLKIVNKRPSLSEEEIDNEAVLLRAYGKGTDLIIDRDRETQNHELLMRHGLAPMLLARFHNGILYRFMRGAVTSPEDLRRESIYRGVAKRLAQWHAVVPCVPSPREPLQQQINGSAEIGILASTPSHKDPALQTAIESVAPGKPVPNVWSVMQKWIYALPSATEAQRTRQANLQKELIRLIEELSGRPGLGDNSVSNTSVLTRSCWSDRSSSYLLIVTSSVAMSSYNHSHTETSHQLLRRSILLTTNTPLLHPLLLIFPTISQNGADSTVTMVSSQHGNSGVSSYASMCEAISRTKESERLLKKWR